MEFRPPSYCHYLACRSGLLGSTSFMPPHLPRVQGRDGPFDPFAPLPPPLHATARVRWSFMALRSRSRFHHLPRRKERDRWVLCLFDPVRATATSLALNSETKVSFMSFQPLSHCHHLPRMQERGGGRFLCYLDPVRVAATSLPCKGESEWIYRGVRPRSRCRHFPHIQQRVNSLGAAF